MYVCTYMHAQPLSILGCIVLHHHFSWENIFSLSLTCPACGMGSGSRVCSLTIVLPVPSVGGESSGGGEALAGLLLRRRDFP